jgi:hypothetical protein
MRRETSFGSCAASRYRWTARRRLFLNVTTNQISETETHLLRRRMSDTCTAVHAPREPYVCHVLPKRVQHLEVI